MHTTLRTLASAAGLSLGLASIASAQTFTLIDDNFTNAVRVGTNPSITGVDRDGGTSNDYVVATNGNASMATGTASFGGHASNVAAGINGNSFVVTNIGAAYSVLTTFNATTLAPGESISVSFNVRTTVANVNANGGGAFRVGLFDSGGTSLAANTSTFAGSPNTVFNDDTGYIGYYSTNASGHVTVDARKRNTSTGSNIFAGNTTTIGAGTSGTSVIAFDTTYAVTFGLARSLDGNSVTITSSFNGASVSQTDSASLYTSFDTLGIFFGSGWGAADPNARANYIDDVLVTYTAVPEPSAFAALAGLGALGFASTRRRRVR